MKKEKSDEIARLIDEGYTNVEIAKKTHTSDGTVSRIRSKLKKGGLLAEAARGVPSPFNVPMSGESLKKLYAIQGLLGCTTLDEAIDLLHKDVPKIMSYKFKAALDFHGTPGEVFSEVVEKVRMFSDASDTRSPDPELQSKVLAEMGMTWHVKGLYNLEKRGETLVQFMQDKLLEHYMESGWRFLSKSRQDVTNMNPSLENEITGDLLSIFEPKDKGWYFPTENEKYFGVHTEPISEKVAWINVIKKGASP